MQSCERTMKSKHRLDENSFTDEIKSVLLLTKSDFITQVISSIEDGILPSARTDLVEKRTSLS